MRKSGAPLLGAGVVVLLFLVGPLLVSHLTFFRVRQVRLVGVRYHSPGEILGALGLAPDHNLFASTRRVERNLTDLPGVAAVRIERELPGTLKIVVVELQPVAFLVTQSGLAVLDGDGNEMGYDPAAAGFDLPFVEQRDSVLLGALARVRLEDQVLFDEVDAATIHADGTVVLEVGSRQIMLCGVPAPGRIQTLGAVRSHIAETGRDYEQLDARFEAQIVVRGSDR